MHIKYITIKILKPLAQLSLYNLKKRESKCFIKQIIILDKIRLKETLIAILQINKENP